MSELRLLLLLLLLSANSRRGAVKLAPLTQCVFWFYVFVCRTCTHTYIFIYTHIRTCRLSSQTVPCMFFPAAIANLVLGGLDYFLGANYVVTEEVRFGR